MFQSTRSPMRFFSIVLMSLVSALLWAIMCGPTQVYAQASKGQGANRASQNADGKADEETPSLHDYKGVTIGMSAKDVRSKLGKATEQGDDQDFFSFSDQEMAQVFYDSSQKVIAVSINYVGDNNAAPKPQSVLGTDVQPKPDGAIYKLVRFPKAGYWASYSRTAGTSPIVTITFKKLD